jgi:hypothetical protein
VIPVDFKFDVPRCSGQEGSEKRRLVENIDIV